MQELINITKSKIFFSNFNDSATGEAIQGYNTYLAPDDFRKKLEYDLKTIINNIINKKDEIYKDSNNDTSIVKRISDKMLWSGSPFPGLRAFTQKDELIYFGRGREVDVLVDKVRNSKFTAIVGASGSGKSSLVEAGLFPRLEYTSNKKIWIFITVTPDYLGNGDPFSALAAIILRYFSELNSQKIVTLMQQDPKAFAFLLEQSIGSNGVNKNLIIFIDQFEELFTTVNIEYKNIFINLIDNILTYSSIKVVVTLRGDFYGECLDIPLLAKLLENSTFPLSAPSLISLHEMIRRPALRAGLEFENGLIEQILEDTGLEPGSLALMAYTLDEIYRKSKNGEVLTYSNYNSLGRVQGAIGKRAESVYELLDSEAQNSLPDVFKELIEVDERGVATRRREVLQKVAGSDASLLFVTKMTSERLLVQSQGENNIPYVEVAHEALLRSWTRLAKWIKDTENDLRLLKQVRNAAKEWDENGRKDSFLWVHERLEPVYLMQKKLCINFDLITDRFVRPEIERLIEEWLKHSLRPHRRLTTIDRFSTIGETTVPILIDSLNKEFPVHIKANIIATLGKLKDSSAIPILLNILQGPDLSRVKNSTIIALGKIGAKEAVPYLINLLPWREAYRLYEQRRSLKRQNTYYYSQGFLIKPFLAS